MAPSSRARRCRRASWVLALAAGCGAVGPEHRPLELASELRWRRAREGVPASARPVAPDAAWWAAFDDPELSRLVERAFATNPTLAAARERVLEARARRDVVAADRAPQADASASYGRLETRKGALTFAGPRGGGAIDLFSLGILAGWELDLWGRVARLVEAAEADVGAARETYHDLAVSLAAEVALAYLDARVLTERLAALDRSIALQDEAARIAGERFAAGTRPEFDAVTAERLFQRTRARRPALEQARAAARHRLAVLLGEPPRDGLPGPGAVPALPPPPDPGLPADLLARRPDVRRAERELAASVARIGAAEAERYPGLTLSGTFLLQTVEAGDLLDKDALLYSVGPSLQAPLLDGGRVDGNVDVARSRAEQARLEMERTLLGAIREVEDASAGVVAGRERARELEAAARAARRSVELSRQLLDAGVADRLQLVDSQRELVQVEDDLLVARQDALAQTVRLYRALGGGWDALPPGAGRGPAALLADRVGPRAEAVR